MINVAAVLRLDGDTVTRAAIALGSVAPDGNSRAYSGAGAHRAGPDLADHQRSSSVGLHHAYTHRRCALNSGVSRGDDSRPSGTGATRARLKHTGRFLAAGPCDVVGRAEDTR
ncbi:hypothetical protein HC928_21490 [bacterium]|nr:hypothetical protein [bacterium]